MQSVWLKAARNAAVLLLGSIGAYLLGSLTISWLAFQVSRAVRHLEPAWLQALLGVLLLDIGKLIGLLPAAWVIRRAVTLSPWPAAAVLVVLCFMLELAMMAVIGQAGWVLSEPTLMATRAATGAALVWPVARVLGSTGRADSGRRQI